MFTSIDFPIFAADDNSKDVSDNSMEEELSEDLNNMEGGSENTISEDEIYADPIGDTKNYPDVYR